MKEVDIFNNEINEHLSFSSNVEKTEALLAYGIGFARENNLTPVATTSGGEYSAILMDFIGTNTEIPILFVDMGPACYTEDTSEKMISGFLERGLPVETHFSKITSIDRPPTQKELDLIYGPSWRDPSTLQYSKVMHELKVVPCQKALEEIIRKNSSDGVFLIRGTRQDINISGRDSIDWLSIHDNGVVFHPLAQWTKSEADNYLVEKKLPKNLNHTDPSRGRTDESGFTYVTYPDGTIYSASHTVCVLDNTIERQK